KFSFWKQKIYRENKLLSTQENYLMKVNYDREEKANEIGRISRINGYKPYLLTVMPTTNKDFVKDVVGSLTKRAIPHFGSIELTISNIPHLHLTIYLKSEDEAKILEKEIPEKLKETAEKNKLKKPSFDLRKIKNDDDNKNKDMPRGSKYSMKSFIPQGLTLLEKMRNAYRNFSIKNYNTKKDIGVFKFARFFQEQEEHKYHDIYFEKKSIFKYYGFRTPFIASRSIPAKNINVNSEKAKLKRHLKKLKSLKELDGEKFVLEIADVPKAKQLKIRQYLSRRKVKFSWKIEFLRGTSVFKIAMNIDKFWQKSLFDTHPKELLKIKEILKHDAKIIRVIIGGFKRWIANIQKSLRSLQKKDPVFIANYSRKVENLKQYALDFPKIFKME
ncbi:hypothetical protein ThvES_00013520, partial [Thiovulum sp. ES]